MAICRTPGVIIAECTGYCRLDWPCVLAELAKEGHNAHPGRVGVLRLRQPLVETGTQKAREPRHQPTVRFAVRSPLIQRRGQKVQTIRPKLTPPFELGFISIVGDALNPFASRLAMEGSVGGSREPPHQCQRGGLPKLPAGVRATSSCRQFRMEGVGKRESLRVS